MEIKNHESSEGEFYSGKEMLELERERLKSADRRAEIARLAIDANNAADQRMFEFQMARIEKESQIKKDQLGIIRSAVISICVLMFVTVFLLFGMMFFGDTRQSDIAEKFLENTGIALSGIGIYLLGKTAFGKLLSEKED